jgi:hypothetical protein
MRHWVLSLETEWLADIAELALPILYLANGEDKVVGLVQRGKPPFLHSIERPCQGAA